MTSEKTGAISGLLSSRVVAVWWCEVRLSSPLILLHSAWPHCDARALGRSDWCAAPSPVQPAANHSCSAQHPPPQGCQRWSKWREKSLFLPMEAWRRQTQILTVSSILISSSLSASLSLHLISDSYLNISDFATSHVNATQSKVHYIYSEMNWWPFQGALSHCLLGYDSAPPRIDNR